jgi:hypothetical protein
MDVTESRGQVVKPPASYSGGLGFKSRAETGYPDSLFVVFLSPPRQKPGD